MIRPPLPLLLLLTGLVFALTSCAGAAPKPTEEATRRPEVSTPAVVVTTPPQRTSDGTPTGELQTGAPITGVAQTPTSAAPGDESNSASVAPTPSPGPSPTGQAEKLPRPDGLVTIEPDADYLQELSGANFSTSVWKTDFSRHTVPYREIRAGTPRRDDIPSIDSPKFATPSEADRWLEDLEPVIAINVNGEMRAYPLQILTWHEIVNDVVGGKPVLITFCPLCNSALAFERTFLGTVYEFGVSGNLRNSDLIMWDRQTETWWQQLTGEAIVGELAGNRLTFIPASIVSWADYKQASPEALVLSRDTGFKRPYGQNPYVGYDRVDLPPFLFDKSVRDLDGRLLPKERVAAFHITDVAVAFPFSILHQERVVNYTLGSQDVVVFFKPGTRSALGDLLIGESDEIGATGVFEAGLDGRKFTFYPDGDEFLDNETGTTWNLLGQATRGPKAGSALTPIVHGAHFWFAWAAFEPETVVYQGEG